jgi:hypothetical protein
MPRIRAAAHGPSDQDLVVVVPALPLKEAQAQWARWLNEHPSCTFRPDEIHIVTGRAKDGNQTYDFQLYQIRRAALRREGILG